MDLYRPGVEYYAERIRSEEPFSFVKFGDGELKLAIPGMPLNPRLRSRFEAPAGAFFTHMLQECHVDDNYIMALWRQELVGDGNKLDEWFEQNVSPKVRYHDGMVWMRALTSGGLYPIIEAIREQSRKVCIVGPPELRHLEKLTGWDVVRYVPVHRAVAWLERGYVEAEMRKVTSWGPTFFVIAAGPIKYLIHKLWPRFKKENFMIDFGSVFDPLCGYCSRVGFWNLTLGELWRNLGWETKRMHWGSLESARTSLYGPSPS